MDTNTMYIEHYIDLHNYISDNIYELNDDIIFTESIWKKVLIGGLAIGGIILLMKNWSKIMGFINKIMGKNIERTVRQARELIYKWVDSYSPKQLENFINHLKNKKIKDIIYEIKNIYEGLVFNNDGNKTFQLYILNNFITNYKEFNTDGEKNDFNTDITSRALLKKYTTKVNIIDLVNQKNQVTIHEGLGHSYRLDDFFIGKIYQFYFNDYNDLIEKAEKTSYMNYSKKDKTIIIKEIILSMIEILIYYYNSTVELFKTFNNVYETFGSKSILLDKNDQPIIDKETGKPEKLYVDGWHVFFEPRYARRAFLALKNNYNPLEKIKHTLNNNNWYKKEDLFTAIDDSVKTQIASFDKIAQVIKDREEGIRFINLLITIKILKVFLNNLSDLEKFMSEWINNAPKPEKSEKSDDEDNKE